MFSKDIISEELRKKSEIFKDERKLSIDYVPSQLPHREIELRKLTQFFKSILRKTTTSSRKVIIIGSVGVGKTALAKLFGTRVEAYADNVGINLKYIHINCRFARREYSVLTEIIKKIIPSIPERGLSTNELYNILIEELEKQNIHLLIALDEIDYILREYGSDILYRLSRLNDNKFNSAERVSLIVIVRDIFFHLLLDDSTSSTLGKNIIKLEPYTFSQLYDILKIRVKEAFFDDVVEDNAIRAAAEFASNTGDARYAIELIWRAGKYAELEGTDTVTAEHVRRAQMDIYETYPIENIQVLNFQQKLLLLAIAREFKKEKSKAYLKMSEIKNAYKLVCEEFNIKAVKHTQLWKYLNELANLSLIKKKKSGKNQRGKTTLCTIEGISSNILEEILIKMLSDEKNV
ncbi:MAG: ORC1-type DNA replication protein [Candidatus Asgardarchaeia archaeon]